MDLDSLEFKVIWFCNIVLGHALERTKKDGTPSQHGYGHASSVFEAAQKHQLWVGRLQDALAEVPESRRNPEFLRQAVEMEFLQAGEVWMKDVATGQLSLQAMECIDRSFEIVFGISEKSATNAWISSDAGKCDPYGDAQQPKIDPRLYSNNMAGPSG